MNQTSNYYNQHAQAFFENTYQVEMESLYAPFLRYLPEQALILDLGWHLRKKAIKLRQLIILPSWLKRRES